MLALTRRVLLLAVATLALAVPLQPAPTGAQQLGPGDFFWQLVPDGLVADGRIEQALIMMVDPAEASATAGVQGSIVYGREDLRAVFDETPQSDIPVLFMAAGFDSPGEQITVQPCTFWTPEGSDERIAVGEAIGEAIATGLTDLGVQIDPCQLTQDSAAADYIVWQFGQDLEFNIDPPNIDAEAFLTFELERPGATPGEGSGGGDGDESPPATGATGCDTSGPRIAGGRTTGLTTGDTALRIDLPDAGVFFTRPADSPEIALFICHVDTDSSITIDAMTAREVSRTGVGDAGNAVLDQIASSARVERAGVEPPRTGDAGLR